MVQFFETGMGKKFFDGTMPRIVSALEAIADGLKQNKWHETVDALCLSRHGRELLLLKLLTAFEKAGEIVDYSGSPRHGTVWDIAETERLTQEADFVIRIIKSRETRDGVVYVGPGVQRKEAKS